MHWCCILSGIYLFTLLGFHLYLLTIRMKQTKWSTLSTLFYILNLMYLDNNIATKWSRLLLSIIFLFIICFCFAGFFLNWNKFIIWTDNQFNGYHRVLLIYHKAILFKPTSNLLTCHVSFLSLIYNALLKVTLIDDRAHQTRRSGWNSPLLLSEVALFRFKGKLKLACSFLESDFFLANNLCFFGKVYWQNNNNGREEA